MRIGVPAEIKANEHRVGLVPSSVQELTAKGHNVYVETGAGRGIAASDADYIEAGAEILSIAEAVFQQAQMIVKVKEPQLAEWARLTSDQILFTYLHLAADADQAAGLIASGCSAIAYETITDNQGGLPLLAPMSEVAGRLSVIEGASCLKAHEGGTRPSSLWCARHKSCGYCYYWWRSCWGKCGASGCGFGRARDCI